jgi:hypothetical protein
MIRSLYAVADVKKLINKNPPRSIGTSIETLLKTGALKTQSGLDLQQVRVGRLFGKLLILVAKVH